MTATRACGRWGAFGMSAWIRGALISWMLLAPPVAAQPILALPGNERLTPIEQARHVLRVLRGLVAHDRLTKVYSSNIRLDPRKKIMVVADTVMRAEIDRLLSVVSSDPEPPWQAAMKAEARARRLVFRNGEISLADFWMVVLRRMANGYRLIYRHEIWTPADEARFWELDAKKDRDVLTPSEKREYDRLWRKYREDFRLRRQLFLLGLPVTGPVAYRLLPTPPEFFEPWTIDRSLEWAYLREKARRGHITGEEALRLRFLEEHARFQAERRKREAAREKAARERARRALEAFLELRGKKARVGLTAEEARRYRRLEAYLTGPDVPQDYRLPRGAGDPRRMIPVPYARERDDEGSRESFGEETL